MRAPRLPALLAAAGASALLLAPAAGASVRAERIGRFHEPVYVTGVPGGGVAVVERSGLVRRLHHRRPLADLRRRVLIRDPDETVDQRGLLSVAFAPDGRRLYAVYVDRTGRERLDVLRRGARSGRRLLDLGPAPTQHHGGQVQRGPDGRIYVSTGMGSTPATSQDPATPGGKLLALDPRTGVLTTLALGLRNPWRFSLTPAEILIGDVGEHAAEEVDVLPLGAPAPPNFGWPLFEGRERLMPGDPPNLTPPALAFDHGKHWCAIVGGYVVRRTGPRALRGRYVFGDVCSGRVWSARVTGDRLDDVRPAGVTVPYLVSFGEDTLGRLYAVSFDGPVVRLR